MDSKKWIQYFEKITKLKLNNNPWKCECSIADVAFNNKIPDNIAIELRNITCFQEKISISQLKDDYCSNFFYSQSFITICIAVSTLSIIIGIIVSLCIRYWMHIKIFLYSHNIGRSWINKDDLQLDKQYDIFLSYCYKDENFVLEELLPKIEQEPKSYKVCIHLRDWEPGEWIHSNIIQSVKNSKCTIIVLSENFIKSVWGMVEFRVAYCEMLKEKRTRVIIILYEEIKKFKKLDSELKGYLQLNTYIKWGDPYFWKKLLKALSDQTTTVQTTTV